MNSSYEKKARKVHELAVLPPEQLADHFTKQVLGAGDVAPTITANIHAIANRGLQFLHSKLPKPAVEFSGQDDYEPSKSEKQDWLHYHDTVDDPLKVLEHVKNGTLLPHHMEALQAVHPDLLREMQKQVMENATPKALKGLSYPTKISVAQFLGKPLDSSMLPGVIASDQATFGMTSQSKQVSRQQGKTTQQGLDKIDLSKRTATETERASDNV